MRRKFILFITLTLVLLLVILRTLLPVYFLGWDEDIEVLVVYGGCSKNNALEVGER